MIKLIFHINYKLFLADRQVVIILKVFANNLSVDIELSTKKNYKMKQSGEFLDDITASLLEVTFSTGIEAAKTAAPILDKNAINYFVNKSTNELSKTFAQPQVQE